MPQTNRPVLLITGASQGLGAEMASRFANWATVYGASRSAGRPGDFHALKMDITDDDSVQSAVEAVLNAEGRIDILINNAGNVLTGASEMSTIVEASHQMDINFLGAMRTAHAVLPMMRKQGSGLILNISSMAAAVPFPFRACYAASKAALEAWAWSLRLEVESFGVRVCCVQVGDCQTGISAHGKTEFPSHDQGDYRAMEQFAHARYQQEEDRGMPALRLAQSVERIVWKPRSRLRFRYSAGPVFQRILFATRHVLPESVAEMAIRYMYVSKR